MGVFIEDGYTRRFVLKTSVQSVNGFYRPPTSAERKWIRYRMRCLSKQSAVDCVSRWMSARIVEWDYTGFGLFTPDTFSMLQFAKKDEEAFEELFLIVSGCKPDGSGNAWVKDEPRLMKNLFEGVLLELSHPNLAKRDCKMCKQFWYNEQTGLPILKSDGTRLLRSGVTLCETEEGCKKGTPEDQKSLSKENRWAYEYHNLCRAVGHWPNDMIVKRNAAIINKAIQRHERLTKTS